MSAFSGSALSLRDRLRKPVPPAAAVLWPLALAFFADLVLRSYSATRVIVDFGILHDGAVRLVHGQSVYSDPFFLLPPSGLFLVAPFGLLSAHTAFLIWNTLSILAAVIGVACAVRFAGLSIRGPVGAALLLVLSLSESLTTTLLLGNLNNCVLLALGSGYLLAERRGRPRLAGVLLGLSLAVKPVFVLVLLLPLLQRRWRTVGWAIAIPAVLNVAGFLLTPHRGDFLSIAVTNLLSARPGTNSSLWAMGVYWGVPRADGGRAAGADRVAGLGGGLAAAVAARPVVRAGGRLWARADRDVPEFLAQRGLLLDAAGATTGDCCAGRVADAQSSGLGGGLLLPGPQRLDRAAASGAQRAARDVPLDAGLAAALRGPCGVGAAPPPRRRAGPRAGSGHTEPRSAGGVGIAGW